VRAPTRAAQQQERGSGSIFPGLQQKGSSASNPVARTADARLYHLRDVVFDGATSLIRPLTVLTVRSKTCRKAANSVEYVYSEVDTLCEKVNRDTETESRAVYASTTGCTATCFRRAKNGASRIKSEERKRRPEGSLHTLCCGREWSALSGKREMAVRSGYWN